MLDLVFATNNKNKLEEIRLAVGSSVKIFSLTDIKCEDDIEETADTLEGNATIKSKYIFEKYGMNCFADDTGLEIESLGGNPGVYSARYSGSGHNNQKNIDKVLHELDKMENRNAQFRTVISLIINGEEKTFEGIVKGVITKEKHGKKGFGYDPIFKPDGYDITFAEMELQEKNKISHRGKAVLSLIEYLNNL